MRKPTKSQVKRVAFVALCAASIAIHIHDAKAKN
jgi:hypothetical protein